MLECEFLSLPHLVVSQADILNQVDIFDKDERIIGESEPKLDNNLSSGGKLTTGNALGDVNQNALSLIGEKPINSLNASQITFNDNQYT